MMFTLVLLTLASIASACETDSDCPSSYCQNDATKTAPFTCHLCGDNCCETDTDCDASYCVNDPTKTPPYFCHASKALLPGVATPLEQLVQTATPSSAVNPAAAAAAAAKAKAAADAKDVKDFLVKYQQFVAGLAIAVGAVFAFAGYKYFNATLFLCGAAAAGFFSYVGAQTYYTSTSTTPNIGVMLGVTITLAVLFGLLTVYLRKVGTFLAGAAGGASAGIMFYSVCLSSLVSPVDAVPQLYLYITMSCLGVIGGVLALKIERLVLVLSTSLAGSLATIAGIGHFAHHFPTTMSSFVNGGQLVDSDWQAWAYAGGFVVMVLSSTVVQFKTTSDRNVKVQQEKYKNSLLYGAPTQRGQTSVYVDHVSGYNTAV